MIVYQRISKILTKLIFQFDKNKKLQLFILVSFLFFCIFIAIVTNIRYRIDIVYTHLFYIPIVMAGIWFKRWALLVAGLLGVVHIGCNYAIYNSFINNSLFRMIMFIIIAFVVGILSEKKDLYLKEITERTAELQKAVSELESFSYTVSHDLKSPLRAIDAYSNIILEDYPQVVEGEIKEMIGNIKKIS
jgi:signal transduction histidine kinase